ncbi:SusC/RagA family TonB-linked outer membrane protein [Flavivirga eckloniae]|uniref:SusC/RagA family TonB-linked outer membrane protein n=1 Tax=Flavivirga eckloniae TaxID=1803846 RepID=UPI001315A124|nr:SusC/RagA family TonB-linked outer membrane protein [Flavivirga eckloniae]
MFCIALFIFIPGHTYSQNTEVKIDSTLEVTVSQVFGIIKNQTGYLSFYSESWFDDCPKVILKKGTIHFEHLLKKSIPSEGFSYRVKEKKKRILIRKKAIKNKPEERIIFGVVKDRSGQVIQGVNIFIKGSTKEEAVTGLNGSYSIMVTHSKPVLVFSLMGYKTKEVTIRGRNSVNVALKEDIKELDVVKITKRNNKRSHRKKPGSVYKIDAKTIGRQPVNNLLAAITGYFSGVNITQKTGLPGGGFDVAIRGKNFINSTSEPLFIINDIQYSSESLSLSVVNAILQKESPLGLINPMDIESVEVLKGAEATAFYGSRGANGVVLITTKRGKAGKTRTKVKITTGLANVSRYIDLLNTQQYLEMRSEALTNDGFALETAPHFIQDIMPDLFEWDQNRYTDWQKVLIGGTANRNMGYISFSGGTKQTQFLFSGSYQNETTVFPGNSKYLKASMQSNLNHQSSNGRFQVDVLTNYIFDDNRLPLADLTKEANNLAPNAPEPYNDKGVLNWEGWTPTLVGNPFGMLEGEYRTKNRSLLLNLVISYRPIPDLEFRTNLGYTDYHKEEYKVSLHTRFNPAFGLTSTTGSSIVTNNASRQFWNVEPQIKWKKDLGKANFIALFGTTFQQSLTNRVFISAEGFQNNSQILNVFAADRITDGFNNKTKYNYHSVFGRLNFNWAGKYTMNLVGRRDGSSRFGPAKQFGNFGAVGAAWVFSEEVFLRNHRILSYGKLRTSYGITGSDNIKDYAFYNTYRTFYNANYIGATLLPDKLYNPDLGWEETKKFEVGLELGFLDDHILFTAAWYSNRSSNHLQGIPLPQTTGFNSLKANFDATVKNTGFEIDFRSANVITPNFKWTTFFNISIPKNKLVKFDALEDSTFANQYVVGWPLNIEKLYHVTGVNPETGVYQFEDYNEDGVIDRSAASQDRQWIEDMAPKFHGGFNNVFNYKALNLEIFLQFKKQRETNVFYNFRHPGDFSNQHTSILNRWQENGDQAPIQRYTLGQGAEGIEAITASFNYRNSNAQYTDTFFVRLRNVSLSYTIPKQPFSSLDASIYLQAHNLLTITKSLKADPEQSSTMTLPILRYLTLGLELDF